MTKHKAFRETNHNRVEQSSAPANATLRLSDTALVLLGTAANRVDGLVFPLPASCRARGTALERVLDSLLKAGLVREAPSVTPEQAWRTDDDKRIGLEITDNGRRAIGLPPLKPAADAVQRKRHGAKTKLSAEALVSPVCQPAVEGRSAKTNVSLAQPEPQRPTKQARLVGLLSEPAGQSVAALGEALGWLPHTVRAALTGLRKKGFTVGKDKNESGTTVYRIDAGVEASASQAA